MDNLQNVCIPIAVKVHHWIPLNWNIGTHTSSGTDRANIRIRVKQPGKSPPTRVKTITHAKWVNKDDGDGDGDDGDGDDDDADDDGDDDGEDDDGGGGVGSRDDDENDEHFSVQVWLNKKCMTWPALHGPDLYSQWYAEVVQSTRSKSQVTNLILSQFEATCTRDIFHKRNSTSLLGDEWALYVTDSGREDCVLHGDHRQCLK